MQAADRQRIRQAIDHEQRRRRQALDGSLGTCAGCGCDRQLRTSGCKRCSDRHLKWKYRTDPAFIASERERQKRSRARRRHPQAADA